MPKEFILWFVTNWKTIVANVAAIEGTDTTVTGLNDALNLATTNLSTLQTQVTAVQSAEAADAAAITALQARATTDEGNITANAAAIGTINTTLASGMAGTVTVTLAKLTTGGSNGSLTFIGGLLHSKVDPT
jgi:hypothetical protein